MNHRHIWDVPENDSCLEEGKDLCGGSDDEAYQDNESHLDNWFIEEDDGSRLQRSDHLDIDLEVVNDNVLSFETMNTCDDDFIYDGFKVENETLYDFFLRRRAIK